MIRTILIARDNNVGLVVCIVAHAKEVSHCHVVVLENFRFEAGRIGALLQGDSEAAIRALRTRGCNDMLGLGKRVARLYIYKSF